MFDQFTLHADLNQKQNKTSFFQHHICKDYRYRPRCYIYPSIHRMWNILCYAAVLEVYLAWTESGCQNAGILTIFGRGYSQFNTQQFASIPVYDVTLLRPSVPPTWRRYYITDGIMSPRVFHTCLNAHLSAILFPTLCSACEVTSAIIGHLRQYTVRSDVINDTVDI